MSGAVCCGAASVICRAPPEEAVELCTIRPIGDATSGKHCHGEEPKVRGKRQRLGIRRKRWPRVARRGQRRGRRPRQWLEHGTGCLRAAFPLHRACSLNPAQSDGSAAEKATQAAETTTAPTEERASRAAAGRTRRGNTGSMPCSARSCSGTCCGSAAIRRSSTTGRQAAGAGVRLRDGDRRPHARAAGELHAAPHQDLMPASSSIRRSDRSSSSIRAPGTARHRRLQGGEPGRRRHARRSPGVLCRVLPEPEPGQTIADIAGPRPVRAQGAGAASLMPTASRWWSATARPAGRS